MFYFFFFLINKSTSIIKNFVKGKQCLFFLSFFLALESLGFGSYISEVKEVLQECKTVALKRRKASSRLENLGIPEEELLRQQQELFAQVSGAILVLMRLE